MTPQLMRGTLFDDFFRDFSSLAPGYFIKPLLHGDTLSAPKSIRIDVKESDDDGFYTVQAELPGVPKDQISISIDGNMVTLSAEVKPEGQPAAGDKMLRAERFYGSVARSFQLPQDIDQAKAKAKYDQGVLTLTLPKKQLAGSQRLAIE